PRRERRRPGREAERTTRRGGSAGRGLSGFASRPCRHGDAGVPSGRGLEDARRLGRKGPQGRTAPSLRTRGERRGGQLVVGEGGPPEEEGADAARPGSRDRALRSVTPRSGSSAGSSAGTAGGGPRGRPASTRRAPPLPS